MHVCSRLVRDIWGTVSVHEPALDNLFWPTAFFLACGGCESIYFLDLVYSGHTKAVDATAREAISYCCSSLCKNLK